MKSVVGVAMTRSDAERIARALEAVGIPGHHINRLSPGASDSERRAVPTTDAESPGIGQALGAVVGGAAGLAGGIAVTAALPGVGPVLALGAVAAALLGIGGAAAGVAVASSLDNALSQGVPKDELYVYEDALRQGRSVVIAMVETEAQAEIARTVMAREGAESVDAARDRLWLGLRDAEQAEYERQGGDFTKDEALYREGFDAALRLRTTSQTFEETASSLRERYGDRAQEPAFQAGYARGRAYSRKVAEYTPP